MDSSPNKKTYRYPRRSLSLHARDRASEARKLEELNLNDGLVAAGLQLVGVALEKQDTGSHIYMKQKNFSANDVSSSPVASEGMNRSEMDFNPKCMPQDAILVERLFDELLKDGTFFWGAAYKNLQNISLRRKWLLICKIRSSSHWGNKKIASTTTYSTHSATNELAENSHFLDGLIRNLSAGGMNLSKTLYKLEKFLRKQSFLQLFLKDEIYLTTLLEKTLPLISKELQFVYLRCFKILMNNPLARIRALHSEHLIRWFTELLTDQNSNLKCQLLSMELLLLLTYVEGATGCKLIWDQLSISFINWLEWFGKILADDIAIHTSLYLNWNQLKIDYSTTFLLLINSILQGFNNKTALEILNFLKKNNIHSTITFLELSYKDDPNSVVIMEQIKQFKAKESSIFDSMVQTTNDMSSLHPTKDIEKKESEPLCLEKCLLLKAKDSPVETPINEIIQSLWKILDSQKPYSESIKLLKLINSLLFYLIDSFQVPVNPSFDESFESAENVDYVFQDSVNKLLDSLQSDEIARRAVTEIDDLNDKIFHLNERLNLVENYNKDHLVTKLDESEALVSLKTKEIENLKLQLKANKRRLDQITTHQRLYDQPPSLTSSNLSVAGSITKNNSHGNLIFQNLTKKQHQQPKNSLPKRSTSLLKSKRIASLSSYLSDVNNENGSEDKSKDLSFQRSTSTINFNIPSMKNVANMQNVSLNSILSELEFSNSLSTQPNYQSSPVLSSVSSSPKLFPRLSSESLDNSIQLVSEVDNLPQLPPPPPPPLPQSLLTDAESTLKPDNVPSITAPAPPPLPDLFKNESCFAIPPPPPPPPLPESLSMNKESSNNDLVTPPAPPLPNGLLPSSSVSINSTTVNLKATSSEKRLKQIHWDKVEDIKDTLWEDTFQRQETIKELQTDGIFSQIEDTFRMKSPTKIANKKNAESSVASSSNNGKSSNELKKISFLSRDLAQQFGINLHMFSQLSDMEFVIKVLNCDNDIVQNVNILKFFCKEELVNIPKSMLNKYEPYSQGKDGKAVSDLQRADRIFLELCINLRFYWNVRSKSLLTLSTYERDYYDLIFKLQKIDDAISHLNRSPKFKSLMFIITEIGNHMNKRIVKGIKLKSLTKLAFVRSSVDQNVSFLHFIEKVIRIKYPDIYGFVDDLKNIEDLGKISLEHVESECHEFHKKIEDLVTQFQVGKLSKEENLDPRDQIIKKVQFKINRAKTKSELLIGQCKLTLIDLNKLMKYYGEDPNDKESKNEFFQPFIEFLAMFKKCAKENIEKEEMERVYEQRKSLLEMRTSNNKKSNGSDENDGEEVNRDAVDLLISKLREVKKDPEPLRRRKSTKLNEIAINVHEGDVKTRKDEDHVLLERTHAMLNDIQNI
ncbi:ALS_1a_G0026700.mRNA.1.CDS.1 [Saccharomyces cerevisiae]|nr:Bnr1p [Saccharomyces cerevisiae YJM1433]CAI4379324.1 BHH_G0025730.mRNA.1.CDS.1 [Saccharomyces cerevisiae]CAI4388851.1 AMP_1a_G0026490.mRNA.1.CDS.1 [Saccharomyces cerevisiae]CAI4390415.1 ALS_1a_G0026700.mRNA.1.CDS.1 [Saccharomyces cerevisiae]CAI6597451.1 AAB_G0026000.mRNA.1.CDS.1 [Saccharomyces cerevisiae]